MINKITQKMSTLLEFVTVMRKHSFEAVIAINEIDLDLAFNNYKKVKNDLKQVKEIIHDIDIMFKNFEK